MDNRQLQLTERPADHKGYGEIEVFTSQSAHCIGIGRKDHVGHDQRGRHHYK